MKLYLFPLVVLLFIVSACSAIGVAQPTATPSPIPTLEPTQTPTLPPASTATPTATLTVTPTSDQIARLAVLDGFTISVPFPLLYQVKSNIVLIGDEEKTLTASFVGDAYDGVKPLAQVIDSYLAGLEKRGWKFTKNAPMDVQVDGFTGLKVDPIKVGGGDFTGPSRERAYLDHLRGPHNGQLSYDRQGSKESGGTILDIYVIKGSGVNAILYVDEYNYSEPRAPVGFTCTGAFPLSAP